MIKSTDAYRAAIVGDSRRMLLRAVIDIIDPDIVYGEVTAESQSKYTRTEELHDKEFDNPPKYATLEEDRWLLDGTWDIYPDDVSDCAAGIAYSSGTLSGDDGAFPTAQYVEMQFSSVSILQACSVWFPDNDYDGVPADFTVEVKQGGTTYHKETYTNNTAASVSLTGFTVYNPDAIRVTVTRWSLPSRRMRMVEIVPGVYEQWTGDMLSSFSLKHQGDVSCVTLPYGTCSIRMDNLSRRFEPRRKDGVFQSIEERQGIDVSMACRLPDGTDEYKRLGVFYQHSGGWRTGDNGITIQWDLVDIVGLLADRQFIPNGSLPTTLSGWVASLVAQLGENFENRYTVDPAYAGKSATASLEDVQGMKCGDVLRYVCMATGTWPRADAETGYLAVEPMWSEGAKITLDNLTGYPVMSANNDVAAIVFTLADGNGTEYVVSGNSTAASDTVSVKNPFIHDTAAALVAARNILSVYGGNKLEITGRGDPSSEIGDVDVVWLDESQATTARRIQQDFSLTDGVLKNVGSVLLQADGWFLYEGREVITEAGTWKAPAGATQLRLVLVGKGQDGGHGEPGTAGSAIGFQPKPGEKGADGSDGLGALVWTEVIDINPEQEFTVSFDEGNTVFGVYSSANGERYPNGYSDIASGQSYARTGVSNPLPGSGDGGKGGEGGAAGHVHEETFVIYDDEGNRVGGGVKTVVDVEPGPGEPGATGARGCAVLYWNKVAL